MAENDWFDLSDSQNVRSAMKAALETLYKSAQKDDLLWTGCFVFACTCIDGLAKPDPQFVELAISTYVDEHFKDLSSAVDGGVNFYYRFRCQAIHAFALDAAYCIGRGEPDGPYLSPAVGLDSAPRQVLNVDRFVTDVLIHLESDWSPFCTEVSQTTLSDATSGIT